MADINLADLPDGECILHFGGRINEVDAFTFSNSLIAIGEALQEISRQVSPEFNTEILIEGVGPGSFRAKLKTTAKSISGLFKTYAPGLVVSILATIIYERFIASYVETPAVPTIIINDDSVIIQSNGDRVIVPRKTWDAKEKLPAPKLVEKHVERAFSAMENDFSLTGFGLLGHMDDAHPVGLIPRESFAILSISQSEVAVDGKRSRDQRTDLTVIKAIFERSSRKWQFVWQGNRVSAAIRGNEFFDKLATREVWFAQGDVLDVLLRVHQRLEEINAVWLNESYEVLKVFDVRHIERQTKMLR